LSEDRTTLPSSIRLRRLFTGSLVSLIDYCCRSPAESCGGEELATSHQVIFTRRGVYIKQTGRQHVVVEPTQVVFYNRNETYRIIHPVSGGDEGTVVAVQSDFLFEILTGFDPSTSKRELAPFAVGHAPVDPAVLLAYRRLHRASNASCLETLCIEDAAVSLLETVICSAYRSRGLSATYSRKGTAKTRRDLAEATKLVLASKPGADHSLEAIGRAVNASPFHLSRVFRSEIGLPIHQYLLRLRLALALDRLADGYENLSTLALELGFSNHSHFSTAFRQLFGISPSKFRDAFPRLGEIEILARM